MAKLSATEILRESLTSDHTAVILFDVLEAYLRPPNMEKRKALEECHAIEKLQRLVSGARKAELTIFYAFGDHSPDGKDYPDRLTDTDMDLRPWPGPQPRYRPPFRHGDPGGQIVPELTPQPNDVLIPKHRWNAFHQTHLELSLRSRGLDTVIIAGGSSDVGVTATAYAARDLDFGVVIVSDATYSVCRGNNHEFFLTRVFPRMGRVMTVEKACSLMQPN